MKNLRMFKKLVGDEGLPCVVLATTMWDMVTPGDGTKRERELSENAEFWANMVKKGSKVFRHDSGPKSALAIIEHILSQRRRVTLDIQKEMASGIKLDETSAGQQLREDIETLRKQYEKEMASLREEMNQALRARDTQIQKEIAQIRAEVEEKLRLQAVDRERMRVDKEQLHTQRNKELQQQLQETQQREREFQKQMMEVKAQLGIIAEYRNEAELQQARLQYEQALRDVEKAKTAKKKATACVVM